MGELDYDQVLDELTNLTKKTDVEETPSYPEILDKYLEGIAKNGDIVFPWSKVKPFIRKKLEISMDSFNRENPLTEAQTRVPNCKPFHYGDQKSEIMKSFDWFYAAPFTIQRLCELLLEPGKHYRRTDKFMRGIEKNVLVVSTIQPRPNKYATPETTEKQPNFKDIYPNFNSSPSHNNNNNNHSLTPSSSGSTSPVSGSLMNGSLESASNSDGHGPNNSYEGANSSPYHPLANSFYDPAPSLNNHHPHLLDTMNSDSPHHHSHHGHHANSHHPHAHSPSHHSSLAPLQQLDSFTNVFTSSTAHHLTHLNSSYASHDHSPHLTNGSSAWSQESAMKHSGSPYDSLLNANAGPLSHNHDHPNDDNENIVVDDDEDEVPEKTARGSGRHEEKDAFFYSDSSNSTTSDTSSYNSDNSNEKEEHASGGTNYLAVEVKAEHIAETMERSDLPPKKRPSPTPPRELADLVKEEPEDSTSPNGEVGPPLTPKKLRVDEETVTIAEPSSEELLTDAPVESQLPVEVKEEEVPVVSEESAMVASSSVEEEIASQTTDTSPDESTPMELNNPEEEDEVDASAPPVSITTASNGVCKQAEDVSMQSTSQTEEESNDQVMDEPMEQDA